MTILSIPTIDTATCRLRAPVWTDFETYAEFRGSERARILGGPYTREQAFDQLGEIIGHWQLRGFGRWMVADLDTDAPLGIVGLFFPIDWPEPEIAWSVFEQAEGRGIAFAAGQAARNFAYSTLGWATAISLVHATNARSAALAARMGAVPDGVFAHDTLGVMDVWRHPGPQDAQTSATGLSYQQWHGGAHV